MRLQGTDIFNLSGMAIITARQPKKGAAAQRILFQMGYRYLTRKGNSVKASEVEAISILKDPKKAMTWTSSKQISGHYANKIPVEGLVLIGKLYEAAKSPIITKNRAPLYDFIREYQRVLPSARVRPFSSASGNSIMVIDLPSVKGYEPVFILENEGMCRRFSSHLLEEAIGS